MSAARAARHVAAPLLVALVAGPGIARAGDATAEATPAAPSAIVTVPREVAAPRRRIELRIVHASLTRSTQTWVDPALEPLGRTLVARFPYRRYRVLMDVTQALALNEKGAILLPERHVLEVMPTAFVGRRTRMALRLVERPERGSVEMAAETAPGGTVAIGGMPHAGGTLLILIRQP